MAYPAPAGKKENDRTTNDGGRNGRNFTYSDRDWLEDSQFPNFFARNALKSHKTAKKKFGKACKNLEADSN